MTKELNIPVDNHADNVRKIIKSYESVRTPEHLEAVEKMQLSWENDARVVMMKVDRPARFTAYHFRMDAAWDEARIRIYEADVV